MPLTSSSVGRRRRPTALAALAALLLLGAGSTAQAAEPGANGKIVVADSWDIVTANPDGTGRTNLTNTANSGETSPRWSRDGTRIAYFSGYQLYVMDADGTGKFSVATSSYLSPPAWSPDGKRIAFTKPAGNDFAIWTVSLVDGTQRFVTYGEDPDWGDNGYIAFDRFRSGDADIFYTDPDRGGTWAAATGPTHDYGPDWRGDTLTYTSTRDGNAEIYNTDIYAGTTTRLTNTPNTWESMAVLSPDGRQIVFGGTVRDLASGAETTLGDGVAPDWQSLPNLKLPSGASRPMTCCRPAP